MIYAYTRKDALADGVQIPLTQIASSLRSIVRCVHRSVSPSTRIGSVTAPPSLEMSLRVTRSAKRSRSLTPPAECQKNIVGMLRY